MRSLTRNSRIANSVPCPLCGARTGQYCYGLLPGSLRYDPAAKPPSGPHTERRLAWISWKQERNI
jgi:hypothetical protein